MDRSVIYPGAVPLETDLLFAQRASMVGLSKLAAAVMGTGTIVNGLAVTQTGVASMNVQVAAGEIYQLASLDATAYSSLAADTTHQIVKQGVNLDTTLLALTAPGTGGFSINYLIQATLTEADTTPVVLPYYNASNPGTAYSGPAGAGTAQNTRRTAVVTLSAKAGTAAATGSQTTPAPDAGNLGIAVVTVANGAVTVVNANISAYPNAPVLAGPVTIGRLVNVQVFTASGTYTPTPGTNKVKVSAQGGGGAGGGTVSTAAGAVAGGLGGTAGAYGVGLYTSAFSGVTVTIGAGGTAALGAGGGAGGTTSFGALLSAPGGSGGSAGTGATPPSLLGPGSPSGLSSGGNIVNSAGPAGTGAFYASTAAFISGAGGSSPFGAGGGCSGTSNANGNAGTGRGSGGGGASAAASNPSSQTGGNGAPGIVIVEEYS